MTTAAVTTTFKTETTTQAPARNLPQTVGGKLWAPMLGMALIGFAVGIVLAIVRAVAVNDATDPELIAALGHFVPAAMFLGFATVFAAISFAIARILGEFRVGGGSVQEAAGSQVKTLKMPATAKGLLAFMMIGMMLILAAVVAHVVVGIGVNNGDISFVDSEQWALWLEAARRFGAALYLFGITLGLATIITVLRFQSYRLREVASEH